MTSAEIGNGALWIRLVSAGADKFFGKKGIVRGANCPCCEDRIWKNVVCSLISNNLKLNYML